LRGKRGRKKFTPPPYFPLWGSGDPENFSLKKAHRAHIWAYFWTLEFQREEGRNSQLFKKYFRVTAGASSSYTP